MTGENIPECALCDRECPLIKASYHYFKVVADARAFSPLDLLTARAAIAKAIGEVTIRNYWARAILICVLVRSVLSLSA
jgi:hypothetical protein